MSELNSMTIGTFLAMGRILPADTSVLIRGPHGIGKSQIAAQLAKHFSLPVIDRRLSQLTEGDMVGLPSTDGNVTRFNPPDWVKEACDAPRLLLLDELNRATPEVMQAAFQLVLDRELQGWKLHPETRVYAAINTGGEYTVNEVDPALLDRFWTIDLNATVDDWMAWAKGEGNVEECVYEFIRENPGFLDPPHGVDPGKVSTSRRSWARLSNALRASHLVEDVANEAFYSLSVGYVGVDAAAAFFDYAKNNFTMVRAEEVLDGDYSKINKAGDRTSKVYKKVKALSVDKTLALIDRVTAEMRRRGPKVEKKEGENLKSFMRDLQAEHRLPMWAALNKQPAEGDPNGRTFSMEDKSKFVINLHKFLVEVLVTDTFGVPLGAAGKDVMPNIPQFVKDKQNDET